MPDHFRHYKYQEWDLAGDVAHALGGAVRQGSAWLARCPCHDDRNPSLSLRNGETVLLLVKCWAGCNSKEILAELRRRGLLDDRQFDLRARLAAPKRALVADDRPRWLFDKALPIKRSLAERYLIEARGSMILPPHKSVRFMPAAPPQYPWPSMVALVTDFADADRALTLHFTDLLPDGSAKAPIMPNKRTLKGYSTKGGVIRLTDDAEVTRRLGVAEGIETSLSVMTAFLRDEGRLEHVWCALNAGNMSDLPVLAGVETLVIYADRGQTGEQAAEKLAERWLDPTREVVMATAPVDDWNPLVP